MAHINTHNDFPGIVGLMYYKPSTGKALSVLAQALLRGPSALTTGERELIATHVSQLNQCSFCCDSHAAAASELLADPSGQVVSAVREGKNAPQISAKLQSLLNIAGKVQQSGRAVAPSDIDAARKLGASDEDIHDTVAIAAAFCLFNRYVDGLGTTVPANKAWYKESGEFLAKAGYKGPNFIGRFFMNRMQKKYATAGKVSV